MITVGGVKGVITVGGVKGEIMVGGVKESGCDHSEWSQG